MKVVRAVKTGSELAKEHKVHSNQVPDDRKLLVEEAGQPVANVFIQCLLSRDMFLAQ